MNLMNREISGGQILHNEYAENKGLRYLERN